MKPYKNRNGNSGITHYETGKDFIRIRFTGSPRIYMYTNTITGSIHIRKMKALAEKGIGLSAYISQHPEVKNNYTEWNG
jgi:hypothetical protein